MPGGSTKDYFAWYTYDLQNAQGRYVSTVSTDELRYFRGHQHGVMPNDVQLATLQVALFNAALQEATARGVAYPGNATVLGNARLRTRSARA
jgi:hypothetical protein